MINLDLSLAVTIFYVILLCFFMSRFFFKPITRILEWRRELIEGRLEEARRRLEQAELKASEYEQALRQARSDEYHRQQLRRDEALAERTELIASARADAEKAVEAGRARIAEEAEATCKKIEAEVGTLSKQLTAAILRG